MDVDVKFDDGQFHHVATTWDGTTRKIFMHYRVVATQKPAIQASIKRRNVAVGKTGGRNVAVDVVAHQKGSLVRDFSRDCEAELEALERFHRCRAGVLWKLSKHCSRHALIPMLATFASVGHLSLRQPLGAHRGDAMFATR